LLGFCAAGLLAVVGTVVLSGWGPARLAAGRGDLVMVLDTRDVPADPAVARSVRVLSERLAAAGYRDPRVSRTGPRTVTVRVGADPDTAGLRLLAAPGRLSFRPVLGGPVTADRPARGEPPNRRPPPGAPVRAAVVARLGRAYTLAERLTGPGGVDPATDAALAPFAVLSPDEVSVLPAAMQFAVPAITCAQLDSRPAEVTDPGGPFAACAGGTGKYLLAAAALGWPGVAGVSSYLDAATGWAVRVRFTPAGQARWTELTVAALRNPISRQVAVVLDQRILTAPRIQRAETGDVLIAWYGLDQHGTVRLAALLGSGPLPIAFAVRSIQRAG
jgi:preprotein translocase subunit SecD